MDAIAPVETAVAAFVGWLPQGAPPSEVTGIADLARIFGRDAGSVMSTALAHFFACGGRRAWVVPIAAGEDAVRPDTPAFAACFAPAAPVWAGLDACAGLGLLVAPGASQPEVLVPLQAYAARRRAFLVADCAPDASVTTLRDGPAPALRGEHAGCSALYAPWLLVADPQHANATIAAPPSGAVAGAIAGHDDMRGVWRAPAGQSVTLPVAAGVTQVLTSADRELLSAAGINVLARFPGATSVVVWGGRTLASPGASPEWKYVNVRRFLAFIERSLDEGTRWAAIEPNTEPTWARVRQQVGAFLQRLFSQGALMGQSPREAYFVRCDRTTMTQDDIDNGRLVCEIGIAPVRPAEFVIVRIGQWTRRDD